MRTPTIALILVIGACSAGGAETTTTATRPDVTTTATASPETTTTVTQVADWRLDLLEDAYSRSAVPGAIAVVLDGDQRWAGTAGDAWVGGPPAEVGMRFRAGSITKPVVATVALALVSDGLLDLDVSVESLLPGVLVHGDVTLRQLLDHTSGIFDLGNEGDPIGAVDLIRDPIMRAEVTALLARYSTGERVRLTAPMVVALTETAGRYHQPGGGYHYANPNYQLAGMVIEQVTGMTLDEALRSVVDPLALESFSVAPYDQSSPEMRGFELDSTGATDSTDDLLTFGNGGNGGLLTTADDLALFFRALLRGDLIPDQLDEMIAPTPQSVAVAGPYGLGIATYDLPCGTFYGHGGSVNGTVSIALADAGGDRVVVIAFNGRRAIPADLVGLGERLVCGPG